MTPTVTSLVSYDQPAAFAKLIAYPDTLKIVPHDVIFFNRSLANIAYICFKDGYVYTSTNFKTASAVAREYAINDISTSKEHNSALVYIPTGDVIVRMLDSKDTDAGIVVWYDYKYFDEVVKNTNSKEMALVLMNETYLYYCTQFDGVTTALKLMQATVGLSRPTEKQYVTRAGVDMVIALTDIPGKYPDIGFDVGYNYARVVRPTLLPIESYTADQVKTLLSLYRKIKAKKIDVNKKTMTITQLTDVLIQSVPETQVLCPDELWIVHASVASNEEGKKELMVYHTPKEGDHELLAGFLEKYKLNPKEVLFIRC